MSRTLLVFCLTLTVTLCAGCRESAQDRARAAAEKVMQSIPDVEAKALAQNASPEKVKEAQQALFLVREYMGEINGKLDSVTVNAIEAFQRDRGLRDDGILDERTMREMKDVLAQTRPPAP